MVNTAKSVARCETACCRALALVLPSPALLGNGKANTVTDHSYLVSAPLVFTPILAGITPFVAGPFAIANPCYLTICNLTKVC